MYVLKNVVYVLKNVVYVLKIVACLLKNVVCLLKIVVLIWQAARSSGTRKPGLKIHFGAGYRNTGSRYVPRIGWIVDARHLKKVAGSLKIVAVSEPSEKSCWFSEKSSISLKKKMVCHATVRYAWPHREYAARTVSTSGLVPDVSRRT